ncbi:MAG: restriction endonuclease subunit S [Byssovorax sp.]
MSTASGTKMPRTSWSLLAPFDLEVPPLPEQRKIAAILSSVDDAIEATQAVIDQLGVVKKAMMAELLTRAASGRHTRFKQTDIGEVPEKDVVPLGEYDHGDC